MWSRWRGKPADTGLRARFEQLLAASVAARQARAAGIPVVAIDQALPIATEAEHIVELIRAHPVVVVAGETGSGKTTQLPKLCLTAGRGVAGTIGCTQPRRIAARAVAARVAEELKTALGGQVGYQVRFTDNVGADTRIKFMTDGILLAEIASDRWLSSYDTIIIDEAHERSLNIDFLLGYLKQLLRKRTDLKIIVTSATIDTARFSKHFDDAPVVEVAGRTYPVEVRYRPPGGDGDEAAAVPEAGRGTGPGRGRREAEAGRELDPLAAITRAVDEITAADPRGDVLVFLPGEREIRDLHRALERRQYRSTEVLPLYARLSVRDQGPGVQSRPAAAHRAGDQRGGNVTDGAADTLCGRPGRRADQALQPAFEDRPPARGAGQPGQRQPAQGPLRPHRRGHLLSPVHRSRLPGATGVHRSGDPPFQPWLA